MKYALLLLVLLCAVANASTDTNTEAERTPMRIIALAPHITEMLFAIGAGDKVVAVSDYSDYPAQAQSLPSVASYASINLEAVLALKPDVVIAWRSGNPAAELARLEALGIRIAYSDPLTLDDIASELIQLGELSGQQAQAQAVAQAFSQQLAELRAQYQHKKPLPVFFAMGTAPLSTVANNAWPQQMLTLCGAQNVFNRVKGDYPQVGIEQLLLAAPELIIQPVKQVDMADWRYWQRFSALPAVKKQQFLAIEADLIYRTTPRTISGIRQLCQGIDAYR
ncbi:cobalamin-binding protein [Rheinheimera nanhaiensis]|uniref:Vitamin B12 transport system substrate-binding protein n=1 Tax=Rheinheimera nanhaiensis E407-8 TaxID=562729 RepID=I1DY97_9GAMM|nr:cobalamin-binding protein [Rheinheimera nanhaiensis]GAB59025.1 vitamin B12 transport system substrate-binding protein [Rheinheimera nanhaiensis E407-8]